MFSFLAFVTTAIIYFNGLFISPHRLAGHDDGKRLEGKEGDCGFLEPAVLAINHFIELLLFFYLSFLFVSTRL